MIIYFELVGRAILSYGENGNTIFAFPLGFAFIMAACYILTSIFTALNCSFYFVSIIYFVIISFTFLLIYKKRKNAFCGFKNNLWFILIICVAILLFYSFNTTLGELNGFDSTHYLNLVSGNIGLDRMNFKDPVFNENIGVRAYSYQYVFQSYFYFASFILGALSKVFSSIGIQFCVPTAFIWIFQIIYHAIFIAIILNVLNKFFKERYIIQIVILGIMIFAYGRVYFNSVFGFYGNSLRTLMIGVLSMNTISYFNCSNNFNKFLITTSLLAACALSSSAVFFTYFYLFALFFVTVKNDKELFKWYSIVLFVPNVNLLSILTLNVALSIIISLFICLTLFFINDYLIKIFSKNKIRLLVLILCVALMIALSIVVEPNLLNFSSFFNNSSEIYDMTLDYFDLNTGYKIIKIYKLICLIILFINLFVSSDDKYIKMIWIMILVFFNPLCCKFLNKVNVVYYRAYDLIINPALFVYFVYLIDKMFNKKKILDISMAVLLAVMLYSDPCSKILYWHESFKPGDDYNYIYKMSNNELEIINQMKADIIYRKIEKPLILTKNLLTQSMITNGEYIYGREYVINKNWDDNKYQLYSIFWPYDYYGDIPKPEDADIANMCKYINDSEIDYLVQEKQQTYYDEQKDTWYSMTYVIDRCGTYPFYENDDYALYYYGDKR